jgi:hypothetical protein
MVHITNVVEKTKDYEVLHHTTFVINIGYKYVKMEVVHKNVKCCPFSVSDYV